jgi:hypothetical protein
MVRDKELVSVFCMWISTFPSTTYYRGHLFLQYMCLTFVKNQIVVPSWADWQLFNAIPFTYMSIFVPLLAVFVLWLWSIGVVIPPALFFLFRIVLTIWGLLYFIWILGLFFLFLWRMTLELDRDFIDSFIFVLVV